MRRLGATESVCKGLNLRAKSGNPCPITCDWKRLKRSALRCIFSPQEVQFIAKEDSLSYAEVITALRDAGVGSMPGTAAEVWMIGWCGELCPEKIDTATWLEIVSTAHQLGLPTTSAGALWFG